ncbi:MAG: nucleotidyl transferase AbiEii/AbiGii toxin family protein [Oscillospiraceae bacterium]|nr:nucleotidyl transferase AbiEii/AbiGii toxin family protein [Candidatus Limimonas coprohippi]
MYKVAKLNINDRNDLFTATAQKMNISEAIIEKDFWVCFTLNYLFHVCKWKDSFAFKGGTSLSKAYNLIERFSEDIDLILDWRILGYEMKEPWEERSNTQQQKFFEDARNRLFDFLKNKFVPIFKSDLKNLIEDDFDIYINESDPGTVCFVYPRTFSNNSILNEIRLEIGAMAAWTPTQNIKIHPYAAEQYPQAFDMTETQILTTTAERSFWEKATILHQEAFRPEGSQVPIRYSRHYYDLYCMAKSPIKDSAIKMPKLLEDVTAFKARFYPRNWARYDLAKIDSIKLMPPNHSIDALRKDYDAMQSMIYGYYPTFDEILQCIKSLEKEINLS